VGSHSTDSPVTRCSAVGLSGLEPLTSALSERSGPLGLKRVSPGSPHLERDEALRGVAHSFALFLGLVSPARPLPRMAIPMLFRRHRVRAARLRPVT
jgi:hypothetical protein